eukprot:TRINITY_DN46806_c0_g1_i1.p1 TRINITY_DN46806_c0_g1~~TRINITY_DN46806_c0_g1_i1.p1  ORF type:complete len:568 (-),score=111.66 TRINITY_DN46806_c0_g1_i1:135-1721(-)
MNSLDSRRTGRSGYAPTAAPSSAGGGPSSSSLLRRFSSRHVPSVAEELVNCQGLNSDIVARFNGLMRHLKPNSERHEREKQVMISNMELMIPEEFEETIHCEFERRCAYGEPMNTELMSSAKWVRLLRDIGAICAPGMAKQLRASSSEAEGLEPVQADIIFQQVLSACDRGSTRLSYELFCKALYLAAMHLYPRLEPEAALAELSGRIADSVPPDDRKLMEKDIMIDADVWLVLDNYKPALYDLFRAFCQRNLENPTDASRGSGKHRLSERSFVKHTQDTAFLTAASPSSGSTSKGARSMGLLEAGGTSPPTPPPKGLEHKWGLFPASPSAGADEAGGAEAAHQQHLSPQDGRQRRPCTPQESPASCTSPLGCSLDGLGYPGRSSPGAAHRSICSAYGSTLGGGSSMNGSLTISDRTKYMSVSQLLAMCSALKILPDQLSRVEIVRIFKRAQCISTASGRGSSYGYLSKEAFVDAAGQLAIEAYSKPPKCDEFASPQEKINAFFLAFLPGSSRETHERFLYGCSGRGR